MNTEKYVSQIIRKVRCSGKKKKEIKQQLLSDVSMRIENGESLEQIIKSMGTPKEIAEEFNQNLPKEEQKAYSRGKILKIIAVIVVILLLILAYLWWLIPKTSAVGSSGKFTQTELEEKVENVILLFSHDDFETLKSDAIDAMQEVMTQESMDNARALISDDWGEMQSIGKVYAAEVEQGGKLFVTAQVSVSYENVDVFYTITFDEDMKLAGLYFR